MRIRDHDRADLALAALTLSVAAAAAVSEAVRWAGARRRRALAGGSTAPASKTRPTS